MAEGTANKYNILLVNIFTVQPKGCGGADPHNLLTSASSA